MDVKDLESLKKQSLRQQAENAAPQTPRQQPPPLIPLLCDITLRHLVTHLDNMHLYSRYK